MVISDCSIIFFWKRNSCSERGGYRFDILIEKINYFNFSTLASQSMSLNFAPQYAICQIRMENDYYHPTLLKI